MIYKVTATVETTFRMDTPPETQSELEAEAMKAISEILATPGYEFFVNDISSQPKTLYCRDCRNLFSSNGNEYCNQCIEKYNHDEREDCDVPERSAEG